MFPVPDYQLNLALPHSVNDGAVRRGVPDVAAAAAGSPGYRIVFNGVDTVKDGTSAARHYGRPDRDRQRAARRADRLS